MTARFGPLFAAVAAVAMGCGDASEGQHAQEKQAPPPAQDGGVRDGVHWPGGTPLWGRRFGKSTSLDPVSVAVDAAGNVVVGGRFFATADFGGGPITSPSNNWQGFVAKYDRTGALRWALSLGDIYEERVAQVGVDVAGNVYVAGDFRGVIDLGGGSLESEGNGADLFVAKLAPDGGHLWSKRFGVNGYDNLDAMSVDPDGSVVLLGSAGDGTDFGTGPIAFGGSPLVARLDTSGKATFVTDFEPTDANWTYPRAVATGVAGTTVVASTSSTANGELQLVVSELGPTGKLVQERSFDAYGADVSALAVGPDGAIFLSGRLGDYVKLDSVTMAIGDSDWNAVYVAAIESDGTPRWIRSLAPKHNDAGSSGLVTSAGIAAASSGVVVTGGYKGIVDFGGGPRQSGAFEPPDESNGYAAPPDNVFAVRLDAEGEHLWDISFTNPVVQRGSAVALDPSGDVLLAGSANGALPFAAGALDATAYYQGFVVKLAE